MSHLLLLLVLLVAAIVDARRVIRAAPESEKTGCFIVKLEDDTSHDRFEELTEKLLEESVDHHIYEKVEGRVSKIITVKLREEAVNRVKQLNNVEFLEEETYATETQVDAPWHLDILDQESKMFDGLYSPIGDGNGVDIYILDTGVYYEHDEFEGRAEYPGFDPVDSATGSNEQGSDCRGHGTHVASLAAGRVYGAAKKARIYSVRVLSCYGGAPWSTVVSGINYAVEKASETGRPSVISMSLGGPYSRSLNLAVANAVNGNEDLGIPGVTVVVSAGNTYFSDACNRSPASTPEAITVGSSTIENQLSYFTNIGPCIDIFAPGSDIYAASYSCETCYTYKSGTSMATPLVSGVVAIMLGRQPQLTLAEVHQLMIDNSIKDSLNFSNNHILLDTTPNRLLHIQGIVLVLEHDGCKEFYSDGSYFLSDFLSNAVLHCHIGYDEALVTPGEVLLPSGSSCNDTTSPIQCTHSDNNSIEIRRVGSFSLSNELTYKCCLPYSCDTNGTGMITANIFVGIYITDLHIELPSDITALSQNYTVNCIVAGEIDKITLNFYYDDNGTDIELTDSICRSSDGFSCTKTLDVDPVSSDTCITPNVIRHNLLTITWEAEEIHSGPFRHDTRIRCGAQRLNITRISDYTTVRVPASSPTDVNVTLDDGYIVMVSWIYPTNDADGYVVYYNNQVKKVEGGDINQTTLYDLALGARYNITVRAYQDILGPPSIPLEYTKATTSHSLLLLHFLSYWMLPLLVVLTLRVMWWL